MRGRYVGGHESHDYRTHMHQCVGAMWGVMSHMTTVHTHQCVGAMWGVICHMTTVHTCTNVWGQCGGFIGHMTTVHTPMWGAMWGFIGHMTTVHTPTLTVWSVVSLGVWYAHVWLGSLKELAPQCSHTLRVCSRVHWQLLLTLTLTQLILQDRKLATKCIFIKVMAYQSCSENRPKSEKAPIRRLT